MRVQWTDSSDFVRKLKSMLHPGTSVIGWAEEEFSGVLWAVCHRVYVDGLSLN